MATQYTAGITQGQVWSADIANQIGATPESFTPTWRIGANTITNSFNFGRYWRINKLVVVQMLMNISSFSGTGDLSVTLPSECSINPQRTNQRIGFGTLSDQSAATEYAICGYHDGTSTTLIKFLALTPSWVVTNTVPFTLASPDEVYITLIGEKA